MTHTDIIDKPPRADALPRIILVAGKGGVGKTTVAASTAIASARAGHRTLVLSFDLAHSLSDAFELSDGLFANHKGAPVSINEKLDVQEIDVQEEVERAWKDIYGYTAALMSSGGLDSLVAEEVALAPGMEDIVSLIKLNEYIKEKTYDVIVLDCPPTSESLRFVNITTSISWYVRRRLKNDRRMAKLIKPLAAKFSETSALSIPSDEYFAAVQALFERLEGIDDLLRNPAVTTVRLVTNADKMVVRETQRAYMYFSMYGITTDAVVINRLLPVGAGYFEDWARTQQAFAQEVRDYFSPVPTFQASLQSQEVVGPQRLQAFSQKLFGEVDPTRRFVDSPSYGFSKVDDGHYLLELPMPAAPKEQIALSRHNEDLVVRVGTFKRNILLPRVIAPLETGSVRLQDGIVRISFHKGDQ